MTATFQDKNNCVPCFGSLLNDWETSDARNKDGNSR